MLSGHALARAWRLACGDSHATTVDLFKAAQLADARAVQLVQQAAYQFGTVLYNLTVSLDTELIVMGGSVFSHNQAVLLPLLQASLARGMPALTAGVRIVPAALGERTADLGALSLVMPAAWDAAYLHPH
jgi:glucokinase